jgi:hypothetical protein
MGIPIRDVRHAETGAADEHAAFRAPFGHLFRQRVREVGIVGRVVGVGPEIFDAQPEPLELRLEFALELESRVIGGDEDFFSHGYSL